MCKKKNLCLPHGIWYIIVSVLKGTLLSLKFNFKQACIFLNDVKHI